MGHILHRGLLQDREPMDVAGLWEWRLVSTMCWWKLGEFAKVTEGCLVMRFWVDESEETTAPRGTYSFLSVLTVLLLKKYTVCLKVLFLTSSFHCYMS